MVPAIALSLYACKDNPADKYGTTMINSYHQSQTTADQATLDSLNKSIQAYQASNGKNPESMEELEKIVGSPVDRNKFQYNPETGTVALK